MSDTKNTIIDNLTTQNQEITNLSKLVATKDAIIDALTSKYRKFLEKYNKDKRTFTRVINTLKIELRQKAELSTKLMESEVIIAELDKTLLKQQLQIMTMSSRHRTLSKKLIGFFILSKMRYKDIEFLENNLSELDNQISEQREEYRKKDKIISDCFIFRIFYCKPN